MSQSWQFKRNTIYRWNFGRAGLRAIFWEPLFHVMVVKNMCCKKPGANWRLGGNFVGCSNRPVKQRGRQKEATGKRVEVKMSPNPRDGCFQKQWYPQIIHFNRVFHYFHHPFSGYPYCRKPPDDWSARNHKSGMARVGPGGPADPVRSGSGFSSAGRAVAGCMRSIGNFLPSKVRRLIFCSLWGWKLKQCSFCCA